MKLEHLFDIEWRGDANAETVVGSAGRAGAHIGNGTGTARGPRLDGRVRFSFYSGECPRDPGWLAEQGIVYSDVKDHICTINPGGIIDTDDGAVIRFDVLGFGLRLESRAPIWSLTGGVRFATNDDRYRWLNDLVGVWEGDFNEMTSTSTYHISAHAYG